ncbi:hypothetical protein BH23GEM9_BH23GEM9_32290 [soil metagenome]
MRPAGIMIQRLIQNWGYNVARRPNYGFVKREKEMKRQQKKAEKLEKKRAAKDEAQPETQQETVEDSTE